MPEETQAFASMLYSNNVAPEQVLFDAGCTDYADDRAHIAITQADEAYAKAIILVIHRRRRRRLILIYDIDDHEELE